MDARPLTFEDDEDPFGDEDIADEVDPEDTPDTEDDLDDFFADMAVEFGEGVGAREDEELGITPGVLTRRVAENEPTIANWSDGDPVKAMRIADRYAQKRSAVADALALQREVHKEKLRALNAYLAEREEWAAKAMAKFDSLLDCYQQDFHKGEKTTHLPSATLKRRKAGNAISWVLPDAALAYQREHYPDDVKHTLAKDALTKRLSAQSDGSYVDNASGEVVEFVRQVAPLVPDTFSVKPREA